MKKQLALASLVLVGVSAWAQVATVTRASTGVTVTRGANTLSVAPNTVVQSGDIVLAPAGTAAQVSVPRSGGGTCTINLNANQVFTVPPPTTTQTCEQIAQSVQNVSLAPQTAGAGAGGGVGLAAAIAVPVAAGLYEFRRKQSGS